MNETSLFPTLLLEEHLDLDNKAMKQACYDLQQDTPHNEQEGGWQSDWLLEDNRFDSLKHAVDNMAQKIETEYYNINCPIQRKAEWININYPQGAETNINKVHMHDRNVLSFVYYVQADNDCGNLTLFAPHQLYDYAVPYRHIKQPNQWNSTRFHIKPEEGKLVCFPSYLLHNANANKSNRDRISIAINADINDGSFA